MNEFSSPRIVEANGAVVGITICKECGAALLLDPDNEFDVLVRHTHWHYALDSKLRKS